MRGRYRKRVRERWSRKGRGREREIEIEKGTLISERESECDRECVRIRSERESRWEIAMDGKREES